jgi:predicted MPP superfamily phosphohydrolase
MRISSSPHHTVSSPRSTRVHTITIRASHTSTIWWTESLTRAGITLLKQVLPPPRVHLTQYQIAVPRLPRDLDGLRVLHLSDLHVHPGSDLAWQVPDLVAGVPHDLLCYTGDFIDVDDDIAPLATLLECLPHGAQTYAVLGNHDYIPFGRSRGANDVPRLRYRRHACRRCGPSNTCEYLA